MKKRGRPPRSPRAFAEQPKRRGRKPKPNGHAPAESDVFKCMGVPEGAGQEAEDCAFWSADMRELDEHFSGTGHRGYATIPRPIDDSEQTKLFKGPVRVTRELSVPLNDSEKAQIHFQLAEIADDMVKQKAIIEEARKRIKYLEGLQETNVAMHRAGVKQAPVDCDWIISAIDNCKCLVRSDTRVIVETKPLSQEERREVLEDAGVKTKEASA